MATYKKSFVLSANQPPYIGNRGDVYLDDSNIKNFFNIVEGDTTYQQVTAKQISQEDYKNSLEIFIKTFIQENYKNLLDELSGKQTISTPDSKIKTFVRDVLNPILNKNKIAGIYNGSVKITEIKYFYGKNGDSLELTINNESYYDTIIKSANNVKSEIEKLFKYTLETFKEDPKIKGKSDSDLNSLFKKTSLDTINTFFFRATDTKLLNNKIVDDLGLQAGADKLNVFRFCSNTFFKGADGKTYTFPVTQTYSKNLLKQSADDSYIIDAQGLQSVKLRETTDPADGSKCFIFQSSNDNLSIQLLSAAGFITEEVTQFTSGSNGGPPIPVVPARADVEAVSDTINSISEGFSIYDQQCLLLKLANKLISDKKILGISNKSRKEIAYDNFLAADAVVGIDDASAVTNKINGAPESFNDFLNVPNHVISAMRPKIRIFKTYTEGKKKIDVEIPLEQFVSPEDILVGNVSRTFGYGLKSFSWDNTSFNEYDRNISATLVMKFNSLDAIISERNGIITDKKLSNNDKEKYKKFRFLELIYQIPGKTNESQSSEEAKQIATYNLNQKFKIKVALGWDADDNIISNLKTDVRSKSAQAYVNSAKHNNIVYYLYNKGHDLKFEKDGSVTLSVFYQSAQEAVMNDEIQSNIFINKDIKQQLDDLVQSINTNEQSLATAAGSNKKTLEEQLKKLREEKDNIVNKNAFDIYNDFFTALFKKDFLFNAIKIPVTDIIKYKAQTLQPSDAEKQLNYTSLNVFNDFEEEKRKILIQSKSSAH